MHHETIARHFLWRRFSFPLIAQRAVVVHRLPFRLLIRAMGHKHTTFKQQSFLSIGLSSHTYLTLSLTIINHPHPPLFSSLHTLRAMGGRFQFDLFSFLRPTFLFFHLFHSLGEVSLSLIAHHRHSRYSVGFINLIARFIRPSPTHRFVRGSRIALNWTSDLFIAYKTWGRVPRIDVPN